MIDNHAEVTESLKTSFNSAWRKYRILFFSAPFGSGKSTACKLLLKKKNSMAFTCLDNKILETEIRPRCNVIMVDDLQYITNEQKDFLHDLVLKRTDLHFVFLSRGRAPGWLMPFYSGGEMCNFESENLCLDKVAIKNFFLKNNMNLSEYEFENVQKGTRGYPLGVYFLCDLMKESGTFTEREWTRLKSRIYTSYDELVFSRFDSQSQSILSAVAPFNTFSIDFVNHILGNNDARQCLRWLREKTTMVSLESDETYRLNEFLQDFLLWKRMEFYTKEYTDEIYKKAGAYFESIGEVKRALDCYVEVDDMEKISSMLGRNSLLNPNSGFYYELEEFYLSLPEEKILKSTELMSAMSMLSALLFDYEESEKWYSHLLDYYKSLAEEEETLHSVKSKLLYLDLALPQRRSMGLVDNIETIKSAMKMEGLKIQAFSPTSALPSAINGGKDFSFLTKNDDYYYEKIGKDIESILGRDGVGFADCALCESKFEKGENVTSRLFLLTSRLIEIQTKGTDSTEFVVMGLLARDRIKNGKAESALEILANLREKMLEKGREKIVGNIDAFICRINLYLGNQSNVKIWLLKDAPKAKEKIRVLWRYQYITIAMAWVSFGEYDKALLVLAPMMTYFDKCERVMDKIYAQTIIAICYYRKNDATWKKELELAIKMSYEYKFIMPIAQFGIAILPMLEEFEKKTEDKYFMELVRATREQAVNYPKFLRNEKNDVEQLSPAEMQVLKLLCENLSNNEICEILNIKLPTVKTHVSRILQKLGVTRRNEVRDRAENLNII